MGRFYHLSIVTAVGLSSFWAGRYFDKNKDYGKVYAKSLPIQGSQELGSVPNNVSKETKSKRISEIMKYGFPSLDNIRSMDNYVLSYDNRNRVAHWVIEHLTAEYVKYNEKVTRDNCEFTEDPSIHPFFRSQNSDYKGSGFDRGHLAAAGNHKFSQKFIEETFLLSNMAPQVGKGFNRDYWARLEKHARKLTKKYPNVYVCTGPLYLPRIESDGLMYVKYRVIGRNTVAVPTHFFKIILMENSDKSMEVEAYVLPNEAISEETPLSNFKVPPDSVERASGLLFFDRLPKSSIKLVNGKTNAWK